MATKRAAATQEAVPATDTPALEPMSDRLKAVLYRWGANQDQIISELNFFAPEWAKLLQSMKDAVGDIVTSA